MRGFNTVRATLIVIIFAILVLMALRVEFLPGYLGVALSELFFFVALAMSLNLVAGLTGYLPFGFHFFVGMGGYAYALSIGKLGASPYFALAFTIPIGLVFSCLFGLAMRRLRGPYFAIGTFALAESMKYFFVNWDYVGKGIGLSLPPSFDLRSFCLLSLLMFGLTSSAFYLIQKSTRLHVMLAAIRMNEDVARICGINVTWPKMIAMGLAGTFATVLGGIWTQYQTYISPSTAFYETFTLIALAACLFGGLGTFPGPILGGVVFLVLRDISWLVFPDLFLLVLGLSMVLTTLYCPSGLYPRLRQIAMLTMGLRARRSNRWESHTY